MVQVEFQVEPGRVEEFLRAMEAVGRSRRRYGAIQVISKAGVSALLGTARSPPLVW